MKHPFYFALSMLTCFFLYRANHHGWSFFGKVFPGTGSGGGRSGLYHK